MYKPSRPRMLCIEVLEERRVLVQWLGSAQNDNWNEAGNWFGLVVPAGGDDVLFSPMFTHKATPKLVADLVDSEFPNGFDDGLAVVNVRAGFVDATASRSDFWDTFIDLNGHDLDTQRINVFSQNELGGAAETPRLKLFSQGATTAGAAATVRVASTLEIGFQGGGANWAILFLRDPDVTVEVGTATYIGGHNVGLAVVEQAHLVTLDLKIGGVTGNDVSSDTPPYETLSSPSTTMWVMNGSQESPNVKVKGDIWISSKNNGEPVELTTASLEQASYLIVSNGGYLSLDEAGGVLKEIIIGKDYGGVLRVVDGGQVVSQVSNGSVIEVGVNSPPESTSTLEVVGGGALVKVGHLKHAGSTGVISVGANGMIHLTDVAATSELGLGGGLLVLDPDETNVQIEGADAESKARFLTDGKLTIDFLGAVDVRAFGELEIGKLFTVKTNGFLASHANGLVNAKEGGTSEGTIVVQTNGEWKFHADGLINKGVIGIEEENGDGDGDGIGFFEHQGDFEQQGGGTKSASPSTSCRRCGSLIPRATGDNSQATIKRRPRMCSSSSEHTTRSTRSRRSVKQSATCR